MTVIADLFRNFANIFDLFQINAWNGIKLEKKRENYDLKPEFGTLVNVESKSVFV